MEKQTERGDVDDPYEVWQTPLEPLEDSFEPERLILTNASFRNIEQLILALAASLSAPLASFISQKAEYPLQFVR